GSTRRSARDRFDLFPKNLPRFCGFRDLPYQAGAAFARGFGNASARRRPVVEPPVSQQLIRRKEPRMKKYLATIAAALLIGGSFAWAQQNPSGTPDSDTSKTGTVRKEAAEKLGIGSADKASEKQTKHAEEIHDVMAQVAEAAITKGGLPDVVER